MKKRLSKANDFEMKNDDANETSETNKKKLKRKIQCHRSRSKTRKLYRLNDSATYLEISNVEQEVVTFVDENCTANENSTINVIDANVNKNNNETNDNEQQNQVVEHLEIQTEINQCDTDINTFQEKKLNIEDTLVDNCMQGNLLERIFSTKINKEKLTAGVTSVNQEVENHSVINKNQSKSNNRYKFDLLIQSIDTTLNAYSKKMNSYHKNLKNKASMRNKYKRLSANCKSEIKMKERSVRNSNCQIQRSEVDQNDVSIVLLNISDENEINPMEQEESGVVLKLQQRLDAVNKEMEELKGRVAKLESLCKRYNRHSV